MLPEEQVPADRLLFAIGGISHVWPRVVHRKAHVESVRFATYRIRLAALALLTFGSVDFMAATALNKSVAPGDGLTGMIASLVGFFLLIFNPRSPVNPPAPNPDAKPGPN
jgi:hypothetical protein